MMYGDISDTYLSVNPYALGSFGTSNTRASDLNIEVSLKCNSAKAIYLPLEENLMVLVSVLVSVSGGGI